MRAALLGVWLYELIIHALSLLQQDGTLKHVWCAEAHLSPVERIKTGTIQTPTTLSGCVSQHQCLT